MALLALFLAWQLGLWQTQPVSRLSSLTPCLLAAGAPPRAISRGGLGGPASLSAEGASPLLVLEPVVSSDIVGVGGKVPYCT